VDPNSHNKIADVLSTGAGGAAGMSLLASVRWEAVPHGELVKIAAAFALLWSGYLMYRRKQ
jgi:hypothetical protein